MNVEKPRPPGRSNAFLKKRDAEIRQIIADLSANVLSVEKAWHAAESTVRDDPSSALDSLVDAEVLLQTHIRIEVRDIKRAVRSAIRLVDAELPD